MSRTPSPHDLSAGTVVTLTVETYALRIFSLGASFVANVLLARLLGPTGTGILANATFWSAMLASMLTLGLDSTGVYYVGQSLGRFRRLAYMFLVYASLASVVGAAALFLINHLAGILPGPPLLLWVTAGLILTVLVTALYNVLFIGAGRLSFTNRVAAAGTCAYLAFVFVVFLLHLPDAGLVLAATLVLQALTIVFLIVRASRLPLPAEAAPIHWKAFGVYAAKAYTGNLAGLLYFRSTFMILSLSATPAEIGIYSIAQTFSDIVLILPTTLINIILPKVAAMPREQAIRRVSETARFATAITLVMAAGVGLGASLLIPLGFGAAFQPAIGMAWILCLGAWTASTGMVLSIYFNGTNRPEVPASAGWLGSVVAVSLTALLAPVWSGYGAAVALSLSRTVAACYMIALYLRDSHERLASVVLIRVADYRRGWQTVRDMMP